MNTTAEQHRAKAAAHDAAAATSFDRCDTDGFLSQWADGINARLESAKAELAEQGGTFEYICLFTTDGDVASTKQVRSRYGYGWLLNDAAAERYGRRFFNESSATDPARRHAANARKGFTLGSIRVRGYAATVGGGTGLAGAASVGVAILPVVDDLLAGRYEVITTDYGPTE